MSRETRWRADALIHLFFGIFASMLAGGLLYNWLNTSGKQYLRDVDTAGFLVQIVSFHGAILLFSLIFVRAHGLSWKQAFGLRGRTNWRASFIGVGAGLIVLPVAMLLIFVSALLMERLDMPVKSQEAVDMLRSAPSTGAVILMGFAVIVLAPVAEETLFRGILYPAIKERGYSFIALWGTSLGFAAIHVNAVTFASLTFLALVLVVVYETTKNLLSCIVAHAVFNATNFALLMMMPESALS